MSTGLWDARETPRTVGPVEGPTRREPRHAGHRACGSSGFWKHRLTEAGKETRW